MMEILIPVVLVACFGTMALVLRRVWRSRKQDTALIKLPRRREEARMWQHRFTEDSVGENNFHRPTQNEIMEVLHVLDQLTPGWDKGDPEVVEQRFLNELAQGCPSLCRQDCLFPMVIPDDLPVSLRGSGSSEASVTAHLQARRTEAATAREQLRRARAQTNAREQITSTSDVPDELPLTPDLLHPDDGEPAREPRRMAWLVPVAVASGCVLMIAGWLGRQVYFTAHHVATAQVPDGVIPPLLTEKSAASQTPASIENGTSPSPLPVPGVDTVAEPPNERTKTVVEPTVTPAAVAERQPPAIKQAGLAEQITASKNRAVAKYPDLIIANSEINLRFVFRYKRLVEDSSPRLKDPLWPEELADECAAAAKAKVSQAAAHPRR